MLVFVGISFSLKLPKTVPRGEGVRSGSGHQVTSPAGAAPVPASAADVRPEGCLPRHRGLATLFSSRGQGCAQSPLRLRPLGQPLARLREARACALLPRTRRHREPRGSDRGRAGAGGRQTGSALRLQHRPGLGTHVSPRDSEARLRAAWPLAPGGPPPPALRLRCPQPPLERGASRFQFQPERSFPALDFYGDRVSRSRQSAHGACGKVAITQACASPSLPPPVFLQGAVLCCAGLCGGVGAYRGTVV